MAEELLTDHVDHVSRLTLIPSSGGRFEVTFDGELVFSKLQTKRHAAPGEIGKLLRDKTGA